MADRFAYVAKRSRADPKKMLAASYSPERKGNQGILIWDECWNDLEYRAAKALQRRAACRVIS